MRMANARGGDVPPLVKAALVSLGFVFIHPFIDGNGRVSRLLAHHRATCRAEGVQQAGAAALGCDLPCRQRVHVVCPLERRGGGAAAAFVTQCAELALQQSLIDETFFLQACDQAFERIDKEFDLPNRTINLLIQWIRQNQGRMPERRRNAAELILLKPEQVERIESIVAACFRREDAGLGQQAG
jgi:hypothetical protein